MIVGTAGHIDHGKTSLVKALTGVDADRLKEEKARGITIDLGYAYQPLPDGEVLGFIDVPGHEKFIHNMLAGATGIDHVLLVIAADDGPMPQTVEHLAILDQLGLAHGAVVLTKIDRVDAARRAAAIAEVEQLLLGRTQAGFPVFPVSSVSGEGMRELRAHLHAAAGARVRAGSAGDGSPFRLAIDRSFTLDGIGTIVTGTVFDGRVTIGDRLIISPLGLEVRVRSLHAQNRPTSSGSTGQRCALNIVAQHLDRRHIERGQWLLAAALHAPTQRIDARLSLLPSEARALRHWTPVHVHLGAAHVTARVALLQEVPLKPGEDALIQLVLDHPIGALHGDRFIVRDQSAQRTLGGGRVLDPWPSERGRRKPQRAAWLDALEAGSPGDALVQLLECSPVGIDLVWFARLFKLADAALLPWLAAAGARVLQTSGGMRAFGAGHWRQLEEQALAALARHHERRPDSAGANLQELRSLMAQRPDTAIVAGLMDSATAQLRVLRLGARFQLSGHCVILSTVEQQLWQRARPRLDAAGLAPPQVPELAGDLGVTEEDLRTLFCRLARMGQLHRVRREVFFLPHTVALLAAQTQALARDRPRGVVTVGPFRDSTGLHRNLGIPMLEFFDRSGFTMRLKDGRRVRQDSAAVFGDAACA
ncbi:MAG: selenocysteine-specific translation elongation factor [Methylibium sp.]|uniref:selenocysteine-specific translation elongation factor n=1 Tax=Methylibium sp. TaxID=2067992 RepID=UPI0017D53B2C|nr:selenocysteine-specific translation elongation factor [Methylibium sp.]MBA3595996.1 selenocysteine-specific translation elongation factor [Methylibium sp.]